MNDERTPPSRLIPYDVVHGYNIILFKCYLLLRAALIPTFMFAQVCVLLFKIPFYTPRRKIKILCLASTFFTNNKSFSKYLEVWQGLLYKSLMPQFLQNSLSFLFEIVNNDVNPLLSVWDMSTTNILFARFLNFPKITFI